MARIFQTGFELGYIPNWVVDGRLDSGGYISGYCIRTDLDYSPIVWFNVANPEWPNPKEAYFRCRIRGASSAAYRELRLLDQNMNTIFRIGGTSNLLRDAQSNVLATDIIWANDSWRLFECWIKMDTTSGSLVIKGDGEILFSGSGCFAYDGSSYLAGVSVSFWSMLVGYIDDVAVNDTTGSHNNTWIGNSHIYGVFPSGQGTFSDWYPVPYGPNYTTIDESGTPNTEDYIQAGSDPAYDTYTVDQQTWGLVRAVSICPYVRNSSPGMLKMKSIIFSNGSSGSSAIYDPPDASYETPMFVFDSSLSGGSWTLTEFNNTELGFVAVGV